MKAKLRYVFSIAMFLTAFSAISQNTPWQKLNALDESEIFSKLDINEEEVSFFQFNNTEFHESLRGVNTRFSKQKKEAVVVSLPGVSNRSERFEIFYAPVFAPELAEKYPEIKSYIGFGLDTPGARLRMSVSPHGIQTMISYVDKPNVFMQPIERGSNTYVIYNKKSHRGLSKKLFCETHNEFHEAHNNKGVTSKINEGGANDQTLQKFRIAISVTGEYTAYHGGTVADALAAINATLTRVNEIFETDMAVTFQLIANNDLVVYTNAGTDPYSPAGTGVNGAWSGEVQSTLTSVIGEANYDIGHLFGASGGGGNAGCIGCVCTDNSKGSAFTSPSNGVPEGDLFDLDFVSHEIGHQMGANHTWAFESEGTGVNVEPGSGSTIMGYAGIEGANNVELNGDDYFHYYSVKQILENLSGKSCQTTEVIANNPPLADAGSNFNIPKGTPYVLKGAASDADSGDNLTYCWEQIDSGVTNYLNFGPSLPSGPMNRSLPPTNSPNRYIPRLRSVLAGNIEQINPTLGSDWETVSSVARSLNWALTVRDRSPNNAAGGQSSFDTMQIIVEDVMPFTIENPVSWAQGSSQTISWEVGETTNATINCQNVNILLSTDGGSTFSTVIASNVPNNGSFGYTVPAIPDTDQARLLVEAADNIFYDVSDFDFSISSDADFFMVNETLNPIGCGDNVVTLSFDYVTANGFSEEVTFSASGHPVGSVVTFSPASTSVSGPITLSISNLQNVPQGNYNFDIVGNASTITKNKNIELPFFNSVCQSIGNTDFNTSTTLVQFNTISQSSGKPSGYSDYTDVQTDVNRNIAYDLSVNVNTDGNFITNTKVWIDWNQNCSFDDPGEEYNLGDASNVPNGPTGNSPLSIQVPFDAAIGNTIMRVSTKFKDDGIVTSCENGFDGEVEDYTINVLPDSAFDTSITLVQINTIDNATTKTQGYNDFTNISTDLNRVSSYNLNVNVSTDGNFTTATMVWIDWNQNGVFTDSGEEYDMGEATNVTDQPTANSPLAVVVPVEALLGNTVMRVATGFTGGSELLPNTNPVDGEVEDYTLNIVPTANIEEFGFENLVVFPNPNNGAFTVKLNGSINRTVILEVFDISGAFLFKSEYVDVGDFRENIELLSVASGVYILNVSDGLRKITRKLVVR
ncbi:reprolysin-like metallopeptidase [Seonamhaeicola sp. ML3]|uniref:zinc-dependent metalloprotease n=1 Tax=Seonamhaeicola sp. ML3 TaxID=2937786 RepID=UPI00200D52F0|nr:GEVED domain-containing protein [Seonamhaeicola sp. ML3]